MMTSIIKHRSAFFADPHPRAQPHLRPVLLATTFAAPYSKQRTDECSPSFPAIPGSALFSHAIYQPLGRHNRNDRRLMQGNPKIVNALAFFERASGQRICYLALAAGPVIGTVLALAGWREVGLGAWF